MNFKSRINKINLIQTHLINCHCERPKAAKQSKKEIASASPRNDNVKVITAFTLILYALIFSISFFIQPVFCQSRQGEANAHYEKGKSYYAQGKYKEAQEEFKKALALDTYKEEISSKAAEIVLQKKPETPIKAQKSLGYLIGEEDTLYISVWQNKDFDQEVVVRPDGMISFPLVGDIAAVGRHISEVDDELTERLKEYVKYPDVSISVRKLGGRKVMVMGEVGSPGVHLVTGKSTLLEAIALAGGFTSNAVASSVIVIRGGFKKPKGMRLNLNRAIMKADMTQNITLRPEDIIYVPKKFVANVNYFVNQMIGPIAQGTYSTEKLHNW